MPHFHWRKRRPDGPASALSSSEPGHRGCNRNATTAVERSLVRSARRLAAGLAALAMGWSTCAIAQEAGNRETAASGVCAPGTTTASPSTADRAAEVAKFLAGGAIGLVAHEAGHLAFDYTFDAGPGVKKVTFGPLPFFAITHEPLSPRREFTVASAGFWVQQLGNEILLTARPGLRGARAPMAKGLFAFNVLTSMAYAGGAFAQAGPPERDTRTMAAFLGVDEAAVGAMLLAPAVLDAVRYYRPNAAWAKWASRAAKIGMVVLVVKKGH
jgi:hypothetical protein